MMVFSLLKKDFLIVRKYVLFMFLFIIFIPLFIRWRAPEVRGAAGFAVSVIYAVTMLLQYGSLKEYKYSKAATLLCTTPFTRKRMVLSKYLFCGVIFAACCLVFQMETLLIPDLGTSDLRLFIVMFLVMSLVVGVYLPVLYRFGYEKMRFVYMAIIMASPVIIPLLIKTVQLNQGSLLKASPHLIYGGTVLLGVVVLAISMFLTVKIYEREDLA